MIHRLITSRSIRSFSKCSEALVARASVSSIASTSTIPQQLAAAAPITNSNSQCMPQSSISIQIQSRQFSDSSHDDFSAKKKEAPSSDNDSKINSLIDSHVKSNRIMLYMKGSPQQPMCGFSATVVSILKNTGADFASVNVLDYPEVREGVKKYAQWPTIPQLYVDGEFVGGCDIIKDLDESGELKEMLVGDDDDEKK